MSGEEDLKSQMKSEHVSDNFSEEQENEALGIRNNDKEPEKSSSENNIVEEIEGKEFPQPISNADHFLVCVFNVSSKVSYR